MSVFADEYESLLMNYLFMGGSWTVISNLELGLFQDVPVDAERGQQPSVIIPNVLFRSNSNRVVSLNGNYIIPETSGLISSIGIFGQRGTQKLSIIHFQLRKTLDIRHAKSAQLRDASIMISVPANISGLLAADILDVTFLGAEAFSRITPGNLHLALYAGDPLSSDGGTLTEFPVVPMVKNDMLLTGGRLLNKEAIQFPTIESQIVAVSAASHIAVVDGPENFKILCVSPLSLPVSVHYGASLVFEPGMFRMAVI